MELVTCPVCGGCAEEWMASDHAAQMERIAKYIKELENRIANLEAENAQLKEAVETP